MDAGNMLKPMLARGELRMVGATTLDEFRKYIEKDPALERRFQQVYVGEPTVEDTIAILRGLKERYEVHHGVRIQDAALVAAAVLSDRYLTGRFLPDKAIDLIDEAALQAPHRDRLGADRDRRGRARIRQLEIERVALAKETDAAVGRAARSRSTRSWPTCRSSRLDEGHWQGEKDAIAIIQELKERLETMKARGRACRARGRPHPKAAEIRYGQIPVLEREVDAATASWPSCRPHQQMLKEEVDERTSPRSSPSGPASPSPASWRAR
jgi:ATP-dependent Clp protease ATP-binding subunit ClpB